MIFGVFLTFFKIMWYIIIGYTGISCMHNYFRVESYRRNRHQLFAGINLLFLAIYILVK